MLALATPCTAVASAYNAPVAFKLVAVSDDTTSMFATVAELINTSSASLLTSNILPNDNVSCVGTITIAARSGDNCVITYALSSVKKNVSPNSQFSIAKY